MSSINPAASLVERDVLIERYVRGRARTKAIFDFIDSQAYYSRPISLRHPIVFYEGHLPAFSFNTLIKRGLGRPSIDERLEELFARGIDPHESQARGGDERSLWPSRQHVEEFAAEVDRQIVDTLGNAEIDRPGHALLNRGEAVFAILEHEAMHQETLLYMWHRLPLEHKRRPEGYVPRVVGFPPQTEWIDVPSGQATLGRNHDEIEFSWDNERPATVAQVPGFAVRRHDVTNAAFHEFVEAGGYDEAKWWRAEDWEWVQKDHVRHPLFWEQHDGEWYWRGMFDVVPLPPAWPVYVSHAEASAFARWRGCRLLTEAEFQRAAYGTPSGIETRYPWGHQPPSTQYATLDFSSWDPVPVGSHPAGRSAWGLDDLVGNGWEWTNTVFAPFDGFAPLPSYPEYSADFFDGEHFVMKGASPVTARELVRPTFRNWFRARYPYVYATFRCARNEGSR